MRSTCTPAISPLRAKGCTGNGTADPTSDQLATRPVSNRQGSSGPTPARGSLGEATRTIPSGTPTFRIARAASRGSTGVAAAVIAAGNGVADNRSAVVGTGDAGATGAISLPGAANFCDT